MTGRGYTPVDTNDYTQGAPAGLHVIIATKTGSVEGHDQRAFFFERGRYAGTDLATSSAGIQLAWRSATTIALSYAIYNTGDGLCCPGGGSMIVRFRSIGGRLRALDPIPPPAARR